MIKDFDLILGVSWGLSSYEYSSDSWTYATSYGYDRNTGSSINVPEWKAKLPVGNNLVYQYLVRMNNRLTDQSFWELTLSLNSNNDEYSKRANNDGPGFFSGFSLLEPQDTYITNTIGDSLVQEKDVISNKLKFDRVVDQFEATTRQSRTYDGYIVFEKPIESNLTGYIEGASNGTPTKNPWGLTNFFPYHGSASSLDFRKGSYIQADGSYNLSITGTELDEKNSKASISGFNHMIKTGFEFRYYTQERHHNSSPWTMAMGAIDVYMEDFGGNIYAENQKVWEKTSKAFHPYKFSAYIQDQITYKGLKINPGVRLDYFNSNDTYAIGDKFQSILSADSLFADASAKVHISPRLNVTYPISEKSSISIAYGQYYRMPELQTLYDNTMNTNLSGASVVGNPNMDVQRYNGYEISYFTYLADNLSLNTTAYYRDVYNQLGIEYIPDVPTPYYRYAVNEFGNSRGLEFALRKEATQNENFQIDLTYALSKAVGTASEPGSNYNPGTDFYSKKIMFPMSEMPLSNDRTHRVNLDWYFIWGNDQGPSIAGVKVLENATIGLSAFFQSGAPYSRLSLSGKLMGDLNGERGPSSWRIDSRITKEFKLNKWFSEAGKTSIEIFVDIYNLLNLRPVLGYYSTTGDPIDDGSRFLVQQGSFTAVSYYKTGDYAIAESFSSTQYDYYGERLYSKAADVNNNGYVTQDEVFAQYWKYAEMMINFQGNYQAPRTVYFGLNFKF